MNASAGDPINTYSGNFNYQEVDFSIPTAGIPLRFERSYNSQATNVYTQPLGMGWTHNFNLHLDISSVVTKPVVLVAPHGSRLNFTSRISGTEPIYTPAPGVHGELSRYGTIDYTYVLTAYNQMVYTFNSAGQMITQTDSSGNHLIFTYTNDLLSTVSDPTGERYLDLGYDTNGRIIDITDSISRVVTFDYLNGDLITATNSLEHPTTYVYSGTNTSAHRATRPLWQAHLPKCLQLDEGIANYRVTSQKNGTDETLTFDYSSGGIVTVTNGTLVERVDHYNPSGVLAFQSDADDNRTAMQTDGYLNRSGVMDANGNRTGIVQDNNGLPQHVTDALGNQTALSYDSYNNFNTGNQCPSNHHHIQLRPPQPAGISHQHNRRLRQQYPLHPHLRACRHSRRTARRPTRAQRHGDQLRLQQLRTSHPNGARLRHKRRHHQ